MKINVRMSLEYNLYLDNLADLAAENQTYEPQPHELAQLWANRKERIEHLLWEYNLHLKPEHWFMMCDNVADYLAVTVTQENADELEAEIEQAEREHEAWEEETREWLLKTEEYMEEHPEDEETAGMYSDIYKDLNGIRPRWMLSYWWHKAHPEEQE